MTNDDRRDTWVKIGEAAQSWLKKLNPDHTVVTSDDGKWVAELNELDILTLWHQTSNTLSVIVRAADGYLEPNSFRFLGRKIEPGRGIKPAGDEERWEIHHRRKMGLK